MPSVIATLKVKEEKLGEALTFLKGLATRVNAEESETLAYVLHQRRDDPLTFVFYEKYASDEALGIHSKNLAAVGARFMALLDGPPDIVIVDET